MKKIEWYEANNLALKLGIEVCSLGEVSRKTWFDKSYKPFSVHFMVEIPYSLLEKNKYNTITTSCDKLTKGVKKYLKLNNKKIGSIYQILYPIHTDRSDIKKLCFWVTVTGRIKNFKGKDNDILSL